MADDNELSIVVSLQDDASAGLDALAENMTEVSAEISEAGTAMSESIQASNAGWEASQEQLLEVMASTSQEITDLILNEGMSAEEAAASLEAANTGIQVSQEETAAVVDSTSGSMRSSIVQIGILAGLAFGGLVSVISNSISTAEKWNETSAEIVQILKDTGSAMPISQVQAYATALSSQILFTQQDILSSEALILSHKNLQGTYQSLTVLAADMATKMGTDLPSATRILTNALADPAAGINQIIRQGNIDLPASMVTMITAMAKAGNTAGADAELLKALNDQIGGVAKQADGAGDTGLTKLSIAMQTLSNDIGEDLGPVVDAFAKQMLPVITNIETWTNAHPQLTAYILIGVAAVLGLVAAAAALSLIVMALTPIVVAIGAAFLVVAGIFTGPVIIAILAIAVAVGLLITLAETLYDNWGYFMLGIETSAQETWTAIQNDAKAFINFMIGLVEAYANSWVDGVNVIINALDSIKVSIPKWVPGIGGSTFSMSIPDVAKVSLPRLETGGTVPGFQGEDVPIMAHGGEQVIPSQYAGGDGGSTIVININNPSVRSDGDIIAMRKQLEQMLRPVLLNAKIAHN